MLAYGVIDGSGGGRVHSDCVYPEGYVYQPVANQIETLNKKLGLNADKALEYAEHLPALDHFVPPLALEWTKWFAFPSVLALALLPRPMYFQYNPSIKYSTDEYCRGVQIVHKAIIDSGRSLDANIGSHVVQGEVKVRIRTRRAIDVICKSQLNSQIILIACHTGMHHRGSSDDFAQEHFERNEFGLGLLESGALALTHPGRFGSRSTAEVFKELDLYCSGNEILDPGGDAKLHRVPYQRFDAGKIQIGAMKCSVPHRRYGSFSGFVPGFSP